MPDPEPMRLFEEALAELRAGPVSPSRAYHAASLARDVGDYFAASAIMMSLCRAVDRAADKARLFREMAEVHVQLGQSEELFELARTLAGTPAWSPEFAILVIRVCLETGNHGLFPEIVSGAGNVVGITCPTLCAARTSGTRDFIRQALEPIRSSDDVRSRFAVAEWSEVVAGVVALHRSLLDAAAHARTVLPEERAGDWLAAELMRFDATGSAPIRKPAGMVDWRDNSDALHWEPSGLSLRLVDRNRIEEASRTFARPRIDADAFREHLLAFGAIIDAEAANGRLARDRAIFEGAADSKKPVFVISPGRAGTTALETLLARGTGTRPFQRFVRHPAPVERNHLFYRLLTGRIEGESPLLLLQHYLALRRPEFFMAAREGRRPVVTLHLDSLFGLLAPFLWPGATIVVARRNVADVFTSHVYKYQFGAAQLEPLRFDPTFPEGCFICCRDPALSLSRRVAWFLTVTELLGATGREVHGREAVLDLDMDALFRQDEAAFEALRGFLGLDDIPFAAFREVFRERINAKEYFATVSATAERERDLALLPGLMQELRENGDFG